MAKPGPRKAEEVKRDPSDTPGGYLDTLRGYPDELDDGDEPSELDQLLPREQAFVAALVTGMSGRQAAIAAGYAASDAHNRAHRLLRRPRVQAARAELEAEAAAAAGVSCAWILTELKSLVEDREAHPSARVRALEILARHRQMLTDRVDVTSTTTVYTLSLSGAVDVGDDQFPDLSVDEPEVELGPVASPGPSPAELVEFTPPPPQLVPEATRQALVDVERRLADR